MGEVELLTQLGLVEVLEPVVELLGIELGTAHMWSHSVRCDVPVLLPDLLPSDE